MNLSSSEIISLCDRSVDVYKDFDLNVHSTNTIFDGANIIFAGTDSPRDWAINVFAIPRYVRKVGWVHWGFMSRAEDLLDDVLAYMAKNKYKSYTLCGHSLGGAIALCLAALLMKHGIRVAIVVTFGAPRTGKLKNIQDLPKLIYESGDDIVPDRPFFISKAGLPTMIGDDRGFDPITDHFGEEYKRAIRSHFANT